MPCLLNYKACAVFGLLPYRLPASTCHTISAGTLDPEFGFDSMTANNKLLKDQQQAYATNLCEWSHYHVFSMPAN